MSQIKLRDDKTCLNCGARVEGRFCPNCGQENRINHPPAKYLFQEFFKGLFSFDSHFWITLKTLLFHSGRIIQDYLDGKRKSYISPIRVYFFSSFLVFFLPVILNHFSNNTTWKDGFTIQKREMDIDHFEGVEYAGVKNIKTVAALDSVRDLLSYSKRPPKSEYQQSKTILQFVERETEKEQSEDADFSEDSGFQGVDYAGIKGIKSVEALDSIRSSLSPEQRPDDKIYKRQKALIVAELAELGLDEDNTPPEIDSVNEMNFGPVVVKGSANVGTKMNFDDYYKSITSVEQFDSLVAVAPANEKLSWFKRIHYRKMVDIQERANRDKEQIMDKFRRTFLNNLPKALVFYLPIFALLLSWFHRKKEWTYYDHGIFTLFYFSFLLIFIAFWLVMKAVYAGLDLNAWWSKTLYGMLMAGSLFYAFFYFFTAHRKVYKESWIVSNFKSLVLFGLNSVGLMIAAAFYTYVTLMMT